MKERAGTVKPKEDEIRALADARIKELSKTRGANITEEDVLAGFHDWVLPDRHLAIIRERLERWREVIAKRAARRPKTAS